MNITAEGNSIGIASDAGVDEIVDVLRHRVAARRAAGDYPVGLEEQLEAEFRYIMSVQAEASRRSSGLTGALGTVERSIAAIKAEGETASRLPGGSAVHAVASRLVARHTGQLAEATRAFGLDVLDAMREIGRLIDDRSTAGDRRLEDAVAAVIDRLAVVDHLSNAVLELERRVGALEAAPPAR